MTASEIHVSLGVLIQKINTHKSKNFLPQELDLLFNMTMLNFKNKKVDLMSNPKQVSLFDTQTSLDNLSSLFETVTIYPTTTNPKEAIIQLPFDFYGWIRGKANIAYDCSTAFIEQTDSNTFYKASLGGLKDLAITDLSELVITIDYVKKDNTPFTSTLFDFSALPEDYIPQDNVKDYKRSFVLINGIKKTINEKLALINQDALEPIYCRYNNKFNILEFTSANSILLTLVSNINTLVITNKLDTSNRVKLLQGLESPITISDTEYEDFIDTSRLSRSRDTNIRAVRTNEQLKIKIPKNVKLSSVNLTYIRFPKEIDYLLGIATDLPDEVINKVITDTAQFLKGIISSESYDKFARENLLIE